ncbi:MAG: hypothetical protein ACD_3C00074G0003 [uncultured bacterium (gcode 4)]|uniref:Phosphoribulokinase/uridine kinase domain-containing protein n=1 Tax=uncultured bacterium (gcode 4) TaxID=1234023 RepID=K2G253_9BACT|nr:MAG: hypothetical protein ACD_3C00074G0003 [uncultured bacterium (gcode 4)]
MKKSSLLMLSGGVKKYNTRTYELEEGIMRSKIIINWLLNMNDRPNIIQIAGGSASGKTSKVTKILEDHYREKIIRISMDDYYFGKTYMQAEAKKGRELNWDQPEAIDIMQLSEHIELLKIGKSIKKPIYSMKESEPYAKEDILPAKIIIIEWLFALSSGLHELGDLNIFTHANRDTRLNRRILRDQERTGQTAEEITRYFNGTVEPMHQKYIESTSRNAHIIIENN